MTRSPTFPETYTALCTVSEAVLWSLRELGQIEGRNESGSEKALRSLVLNVSKTILDRLPCLQLDDDSIEEMDSKYCHLLAKMQAEA